MNTVEYDTDCYYARIERADRDYQERYADALCDIKHERYFTVRLEDIVDLATPEEIVSFYSRSTNPLAGVLDEYTDVTEALELKQQRAMGQRLGTDEYVTEQGFPFIPSRIMPALRRIEAERRAQE